MKEQWLKFSAESIDCVIAKNGGIQCFRKRGKTQFRASVFDFMNKLYEH